MEEPRAAADLRTDVSLPNFRARLWEQLVHFHVMRLTDSLFLWVGATPHLRKLAVAMCSRFDSIPVCASLLGDISETTSTSLACSALSQEDQQTGVCQLRSLSNTDSDFTLVVENRIKEEMETVPEKF